MNRSHPDGEHMSEETLDQIIAFLLKIKPITILIGGGEPTEHPQFLKFIDKFISTNIPVILTTNGMWLKNNEYTKEILKRRIMIQLTNDKRYYPIKISDPKIQNVTYVDRIESLSLSGRARDNNMQKLVTKAPHCFNLRSIARYVHRNNFLNAPGEFCFKMMLTLLEGRGKWCQPSINLNGDIVPGETTECYVIGHVTDHVNTIYSNLVNMQGCNTCTMIDVLSRIEKDAVGEK
jgi:hypothetical protein